MVAGNEKCLLVIRTSLYCLIFVLSMFIFSPMALQLNKHDGLCVLYGHPNIIDGYGEKTTCNYCVAVSVLFCFIYGGVMAVIGILTLCGTIKRPENFHGLLFFINVVLDVLSFILVLILACIISVGFKTLCDNLMGEYTSASSCKDIYLKIPSSGDEDHFYGNIAIAEGGAWTCFLAWLVQMVLGVFIMWRNDMIPFLNRNSSGSAAATPTTDKY